MRTAFVAIALAASSVSAIQINFVNNCAQPVWAAVGAAPNGVPNPKIAWGQELSAHGGQGGFHVDDSAIGIRAWGRTGCDASGNNCKTGGCRGGLVCDDGGITSGVLVSEYGWADFGAQWGGVRTSWDLSRVGLSINLDTRLVCSDGQTLQCTAAFCPDTQAYDTTNDGPKADRNSPLGKTYTHTFCP